MKEGYWANYNTGKVFLIDEHEMWIRREGNADKLGLSEKLFTATTAKYKPQKDRDEFLKNLMRHAPIMRVRGHGDVVTFEYSSKSEVKPWESIRRQGSEWFGPYTVVNIYNFETRTTVRDYWRDMPIEAV
jgi:hypothetical protein